MQRTADRSASRFRRPPHFNLKRRALSPGALILSLFNAIRAALTLALLFVFSFARTSQVDTGEILATITI